MYVLNDTSAHHQIYDDPRPFRQLVVDKALPDPSTVGCRQGLNHMLRGLKDIVFEVGEAGLEEEEHLCDFFMRV